MSRTSRIPGFYKESVESRRRLLAEAADLDGAEVARGLASGGLDVTTADKTVEIVRGQANERLLEMADHRILAQASFQGSEVVINVHAANCSLRINWRIGREVRYK